METLLSLLVGLGLAAACGFRVFVPLLGMSIAAQAGQLELASGFAWIATPVATGALLVATLLEVGAYFVPWLDNALDALATPAAVVAGTMATGAVLGDASPFLRWSLAAVAGGGIAASVQTATVVARGSSAVGTAGLANPLLAGAELVGAAGVTVLAVFLPLVALALVGAAVAAVFAFRRRTRPRPA